MRSKITEFVLVSSLVFFVVGVTPAVFAGDDGTSSGLSATPVQNQIDRLAAKAMTDDELDQVSAGIQAVMMPPLRSFNFINVGGQVKVNTSPFATNVYVKPSIMIRTFNFGTVK